MNKCLIGLAVAGALAVASGPTRAGADVEIHFPLPSVDVHIGGPSIYVDVAPPPPRRETRPRPRAGYDWRPGYWQWDGRHHVWVAGSWIPERQGSVWVADGWTREDQRWRYVPGHWERSSDGPRDRDGWSRDDEPDRRGEPEPRQPGRNDGWTRDSGGWGRDERGGRTERDARDDDWGARGGQHFQVPPDRVPPRGTCRVWFRDLPPDRQSPPMSCAKARRDAGDWGGMVIWASGPESFQNGRVEASDYGRHRLYNVPPDRLPPPGSCRVWRDNAPPDRQSPPESCASAERHARAEGGRVLYMPGSDIGY